MAKDIWLDYLHPMKPLLRTILLLMLAALGVAAQPSFAQVGSPAQAKALCNMHAVAAAVESSKPDASCLNMEKCRGVCLCTGCGHCAPAGMSGTFGQHRFHSVSVLLQPLTVQYTSLNPPPESPPPRSHFPC